MAITFHPRPGQVLICDFDTGFQPPEMVKKRPIVAVSRGNGQLLVIVPLSTTMPVPIETWHVELHPESLPESLRSARCWAKCDMVTCVSYHRLDRVLNGKDPNTGKRLYVTHELKHSDLEQIRTAIRKILQL